MTVSKCGPNGDEFLISALEDCASILKLNLGDFCNESKRSPEELAKARGNG